MNAVEPLEFVANIPKELGQYRDALGAGLFYLSLDTAPMAHYPTAGSTATRIKVSGQATQYLMRLEARLGSRRQAVINALAWVAAQPASRRSLLENTVI